MSEEELEIQEPTSVEEQLNTETSKPTKLNKNGKPRKQLSSEALERLAKAREKANAMRQQAYTKKLEEKVKNLKEQNPVINEYQGERPETATKEGVVGEELPYPEHAEVKEVVEKKVKPKEKGKKKTKIIVEQSSDDSDEFEPNTNVVFVKRVSRKKKEPPPEPVKEPEHQMELPPPEPPKPPRPELTPQQRLLKSQYEGMFTGGFMNNNNLMRRHY
jgi:hypothetical protein